MSELSVFEFVLMATQSGAQTWAWNETDLSLNPSLGILISLGLSFLTCKWGIITLIPWGHCGEYIFKMHICKKKLNIGIKIYKHIVRGTIITFHSELVTSYYFQLSLLTAVQVSSHINQKYSLKYSVQLDRSFYIFKYFFL